MADVGDSLRRLSSLRRIYNSVLTASVVLFSASGDACADAVNALSVQVSTDIFRETLLSQTHLRHYNTSIRLSRGVSLRTTTHVYTKQSFIHTIRYDTRCCFNVRSKANMVSLIYRTEPTTIKCKIVKTKSSKQMCSEITVNSLGNPCSKSWRRKRKGCSGKDLQKGRF